MYYFKFSIPANEDGSRVTYSSGWYGTMSRCPSKAEVLLYNDNEGYGIARADDIFIPPEIKVISKAEALETVAGVKDEDGIFFGEKLANRWLPEAETEDIVDTAESLGEESKNAGKIILDTFIKFCPSCHKLVAKIGRYEDGSMVIWQGGEKVIDGIKAVSLVLLCLAGHKIKVTLDG